MARTKRRKNRTHVPIAEDPAKKGPPKSFVFWRGQHGLVLKGLETDLRKLMQPHTATNLKESKRNQLKDFVNIAGPLGVSHFMILTATQHSCYLRIAKVPRGPTLTMRIHSYSLMRDVAAAQQKPRLPESLWKTSPLVVMNNFSGQEHLKLATVLFQNLFPAINVQAVKLSACQRVVLLSFDKATNRISFRHYGITVQPSGVTKSVKALIGRRQLPDMGSLEDVAELLTKSGYGSESEGEEAAEARVTLAQDMGRGNIASRQSRIRLQEVGPRMELEIVKAEEGLCGGRVLHHQHVHKSAAEVDAQTRTIQSQQELKEKRKRQQEENVKRKAASAKRKAEAEPEDAAAAAGPSKKPKKKDWWEAEVRGGQPLEDDDDVEYYRQEVGEEPDDVHGLRTKREVARGGRGRGREGRRSSGRNQAVPRKASADKPARAAKRSTSRGRGSKSRRGRAGS